MLESQKFLAHQNKPVQLLKVWLLPDFLDNKMFLGDTVSGERLCCGLSLFESMMKELQKTLLEDKEWKGMKPPANGCIYIEESQEFHRIWSACQWIMARVSAQF